MDLGWLELLKLVGSILATRNTRDERDIGRAVDAAQQRDETSDPHHRLVTCVVSESIEERHQLSPCSLTGLAVGLAKPQRHLPARLQLLLERGRC